MLHNDYLALLLTLALSLIWLRLNDFAARRGWIESRLSRKIIHIGTGPLFVACWLLFSDAILARYLAALVPFAITVQFILVGVGFLQDEAAVQAMSRSGDRREILRGPLLYGLVFVFLTILFWKNTPTGIVALMLLCGGDGLADILGRRFGRTPLPWNQDKSWAGSLGMFLGGWLFAALLILVYVIVGVFPPPVSAYLPAISLISLAGVLVESLPFRDIDNLTVPLVATLLGLALF